MGLFDSAEEQARKAGLRKMEDKRVAFAQQLARQGFAPEKMLFAQNDNGGFTALCRFAGKYWLIISPGFGTDDDFILESYDALDWRAEAAKAARSSVQASMARQAATAAAVVIRTAFSAGIRGRSSTLRYSPVPGGERKDLPIRPRPPLWEPAMTVCQSRRVSCPPLCWARAAALFR